MKYYAGVTSDDTPRHGGEYVHQHGFGHEAINFKPHNGKVYGFVELRTGTINIKRLDPNAEKCAEDVLVAWRARSRRGSVIVGWYKHATVYSQLQQPIPGRSFQYRRRTISPWWIIKADHSDAFIVPPQYRFFGVPVSHKGFGSQTFVSFLDSGHDEVVSFKNKLLQYMNDAESGHYPSLRQGKKPLVDQVHKLKIERAAIDAASRYYGDQGYDVISVEREHVGYDLEARYKSDTLLIEVKGTNHRADHATVNLSPNEYRKSKSRTRQYRICIVTNALSVGQVNDFLWDPEEGVWRDENTGKRLSVEEATSANMTIQ
jgi:hypothetical protein